MASIKLDDLSLSELKTLEKDVARAIADFSGRKKAAALSALEEHAKSLGFSLAELTGKKRRKTRAGTGGAKYRHLENAELTWSGIGRKPAWFKAALASGATPESMAI